MPVKDGVDLVVQIADSAILALAGSRSLLDKARSHVLKERGHGSADGKASRLESDLDWPAARTQIQQDLPEGKYAWSGFRIVEVTDEHGKTRKTFAATSNDATVARAICVAASEVFAERVFSPAVCAYRPKRGPLHAVSQLAQAISARAGFMISVDIQDFFPSINRERLLEHLLLLSGDPLFVKTVRERLQAGDEKTEGLEVAPGIFQGDGLAALLANLYLTREDALFESRFLYFGRYSDDIVVLVGTEEEAERALSYLKEVLGRLGLRVKLTDRPIVDLTKDEGLHLGWAFRLDAFGCPRLTAAQGRIHRMRSRLDSLNEQYPIRRDVRDARAKGHVAGVLRYFLRAENFNEIVGVAGGVLGWRTEGWKMQSILRSLQPGGIRALARASTTRSAKGRRNTSPFAGAGAGSARTSRKSLRWLPFGLTPAGEKVVTSILWSMGECWDGPRLGAGLIRGIAEYRSEFGNLHPLCEEVKAKFYSWWCESSGDTELWQSEVEVDERLSPRELAPADPADVERSRTLSIPFWDEKTRQDVVSLLAQDGNESKDTLGKSLEALCLTLTVMSTDRVRAFDDDWLSEFDRTLRR